MPERPERKKPLKGFGVIILFIGNVVTFEKYPFASRRTEQSEVNIFVKVSEAVHFNLDKYIYASDTLEL